MTTLKSLQPKLVFSSGIYPALMYLGLALEKQWTYLWILVAKEAGSCLALDTTLRLTQLEVYSQLLDDAVH